MGRNTDGSPKRETIKVRLTKEQKEKLKNYAKNKRITMSEAIKEYINGLSTSY
jgi:predicted DNA-binding protein